MEWDVDIWVQHGMCAYVSWCGCVGVWVCNRVEWSGVEWSGVEWSGVEYLGVAWRVCVCELVWMMVWVCECSMEIVCECATCVCGSSTGCVRATIYMCVSELMSECVSFITVLT